MSDHANADALWIGNYAYYNDGNLVGGWIKLPFSDEEFRRFLGEEVMVDALHEEYGIFDTDLMGPLGEIGVKIGEYDDLDAINLLARVCADHPEADLEAVRAFMDNQGGPTSFVEYANAVAQAGEIPFYRWEDSPERYGSDEEHFAYQEIGNLGGPERLGREELAEYFDYERYGRRLMDEGIRLGENGFIDLDDCVVADDFDMDIVDWCDWPFYEDAWIGLTQQWDFKPSSFSKLNDYTLIESFVILDHLDSREEEAVRLYRDYAMPSACDPLDLAIVARQADNIAYTQWDWSVSASSDAERLGKQYAAEHDTLASMSKETLAEYFDYERWGRDASCDCAFAADGYLDCQQDGPDLDFYTKEELAEAIDGIDFSESIPNPYDGKVRRPEPSAVALAAASAASGQGTRVVDVTRSKTL